MHLARSAFYVTLTSLVTYFRQFSETYSFAHIKHRDKYSINAIYHLPVSKRVREILYYLEDISAFLVINGLF